MSEQLHQLAAIMFTDIVGYSALMSNDEQKAFDLLKTNREIQKPIIEQHGGRWIKELGDGVMASFNTVSDAVNAAIKIQETCDTVKDLLLRIGIHEGEMIFENNDVFGDGVNIASRIQALANPGSIWISESVYKNVSNKNNITTAFVKLENLKNIKEPVRIYEVKMKHKAVQQPVITNAYKEPAKTISAKSIAVLPFVNISNDPEQEYFSDGMAEEILNSLAHLADLKVAGRTSSFQFKGVKVDLREVGEKLGVQTVLEGSVRKQGNQLRVTAQLINAEDGFHIWSERYDRTMDNIFAIQDEIAFSITEKLKITLFEKEKAIINKTPTANNEAYELYLKGRFFWNKRGMYLKKGLTFFMQAVALDPQFALAYAGIADTYSLFALYEILPPHEAMPRAREAAEKAILLDATLIEAHAVLVFVTTFYDWDWPKAKKQFQQTFAINSKYALAHYWFSFYLSCVEGKHDEAIKEAMTGVELEPLVPASYNVLSAAYLYAGKFDDALKASQTALDLDPNYFLSIRNLGVSFIGLKRYAEAIEALKTSANLSQHPWPIADLSVAYSLSGDLENAQKLFHELEARSQTEFISGMQLFIAAYSSEYFDRAFDYLEKAFEERNILLASSKASPFLADKITQPRYEAIIRKMNFPD
jgi:TolB-like protein/class 3 adenylate cyclase/Tfp pilus assembly protein PilF